MNAPGARPFNLAPLDIRGEPIALTPSIIFSHLDHRRGNPKSVYPLRSVKVTNTTAGRLAGRDANAITEVKH